MKWHSLIKTQITQEEQETLFQVASIRNPIQIMKGHNGCGGGNN